MANLNRAGTKIDVVILKQSERFPPSAFFKEFIACHISVYFFFIFHKQKCYDARNVQSCEGHATITSQSASLKVKNLN